MLNYLLNLIFKKKPVEARLSEQIEQQLIEETRIQEANPYPASNNLLEVKSDAIEKKTSIRSTPKKKPLLQFNADYYKNNCSMRCAYPIRKGLSKHQLEERDGRIKAFESNQLFKSLNLLLDGIFDRYKADEITLREHGVFFERFYKSSIKSNVIKEMYLGDRLAVSQSLIKNHGYYAHLSKNKHDIFYVIIHLSYENQLYKIAHNQAGGLDLLEDWCHRHLIEKSCAICGKMFSLDNIPDWLYFSSNGNKNCCFQCEIIEKPTKAMLKDIIPKFVEECGFIPKASTHPLEYSFSSRLSPDKWIELTKLFGAMGGIEHVKKKYGSWFKAMVETNAVPNGVKLSSRGIWCLANDGHQCHSIDEQIIDNWLHANNIPHSREPLYPKHNLLNEHGKRRADWKAGEVFIEYFGLVGDKDYDKKTNEKIMLASINNIPLIELYPNDMNSLQLKLGTLITPRLKPSNPQAAILPPD